LIEGNMCLAYDLVTESFEREKEMYTKIPHTPFFACTWPPLNSSAQREKRNNREHALIN
jgi:hypothetical protein